MKKLGSLLILSLLVLAGCQNEELDSVLQKSTTLTTVIPQDAIVIDFENFSAGDIVSTVSPDGCDGAIAVYGTNPDFPDQNTAMVFDSASPTGGDIDLGTPNQQFGGPGVSSDSADGNEASNDTDLGKVLIISEDLDNTDPDDSAVAGSIYEFDFSAYGEGFVKMYGFNMLDLDPTGAKGPTIVKLFDDSGTLLLEKEIPYGPDNNLQWVDLEETDDVTIMVLELNNSGAIDNITFTCEEPPVDCSECDGKVTKLTLQYNGSEAAEVIVLQKKDEVEVFNGTVQPGDQFSIMGMDNKGTLSTEIIIFVNGSEHTKIHTSCSQPIGPGLISGDFEVIEGESRNGGALCPVEDDPDDPDDEDCCDGKVTALTLQYNGAEAADIVVLQKKDEVEVFSATVQPGEQFSMTGMDKHGTLSTEIIILVNGSEHTKIHTSCSQPIGPGLISGDFEVIEGTSRNGGALCPVEDDPGVPDDPKDDEACCDGKVSELTLQYNGAAAAEVIILQKKDEVEVFNGNVQPGEQVSITGMDKNGTLGTEIIIMVNGTEHTKIHTSCSQPIGPGLISGDFEVIEGISRNGGSLCAVN